AYSIATLLIGIIPNFSNPPIFTIIHGINAIIIFLGFGLIALISAYTMLKEYRKERDNSIFSWNLLILYVLFLCYYLICFSLIVVFFQSGVSGRHIIEPSVPFYCSPPFYEWQAYMIIFCLITIQCLIFPED
ncbi:MAG: hypothetical protein ACTSO9_20960, partial [Candidatus Helarchaeota archaeon]